MLSGSERESLPLEKEEDSAGLQRKNPKPKKAHLFKQTKRKRKINETLLLRLKRWKWVSLGLVRLKNQKDKDELRRSNVLHSRERHCREVER